jgi:hypothetical protein
VSTRCVAGSPSACSVADPRDNGELRMNNRPRTLQAASLLAAAALALTACSSGGDEPVEASEETTPSESASSTDTPKGKQATPPGTQLTFGDSATIDLEEGNKSTLLNLRVESAVQGSLDDFQGFDLNDPYKKRGNYYYVRVAVRNAGKDTVGGVPVPLWGISGDNTLLQAVEFKSSFAKCPTEPLPKKFKPKDSFKTCLVYLSPNKGKLQGVSYRPTEQYEPIEWRGPVKMLPKPKKGKGKKQ